jgi:hypothetical protein
VTSAGRPLGSERVFCTAAVATGDEMEDEHREAAEKSVWRWLVYGSVMALVVLTGVTATQKVIAEWFLVDCSNNFTYMGIILRMYAQDSVDNLYPPVRPGSGAMGFDLKLLLPDYATDETLGVFSYHENNITSTQSGEPNKLDFYYPGYAIADQAELEAFAAALRKQIADGGDFTENLPVAAGAGSWGGNSLQRLSQETAYPPSGSELANTDAGPGVPLLIEKLGHYRRPGGYVLYADGTSEFIEYPGKWPMTESAMALLKKLGGLAASHAARTP